MKIIKEDFSFGDKIRPRKSSPSQMLEQAQKLCIS